MSDEFGTVNIKSRSAERAREIEVMREHYRRHREALSSMADDAPTEHLAGEYRRLIKEIDLTFTKLDELEGLAPAVPPRTPSDTQPLRRTEPGRRPLISSPAAAAHAADDEPASAQSRVLMIVVAGLIVLALIGWLMWRASSDERPVTPIVEDAEATDTVAAATPPPPPDLLALAPESHDFGVVRKGTRAARQFEIVNTTDNPIAIKVARSACRCLYYDYADVIAPNGRETLTVTIDGSKAQSGQLQESVAITSSGDASVVASFQVSATIR
ncbi:MAG TPA: DUF1573 domain-containing protein [Thermoanaerobaculia bacterium]|nr:DUF1573 domain-containing protein [Thermoanaerobaculia bacterium]